MTNVAWAFMITVWAAIKMCISFMLNKIKKTSD